MSVVKINSRNNIWLLRKKHGFNQKQLAYILGHKSSSLLNRWEKGASLPDLKSVLKLAVALSTSVENIFQVQYEFCQIPILVRKNEVKRQLERSE